MLYTSPSLPLMQITLDDWLLVKVSGPDSSKFLQGQLTADMTKLSDTNSLVAAQCDPKGKVLSSMQLFKRGDDIYYVVRKSLAEMQLAALKKYAVFSKISFTIDDALTMVGIAGEPMATTIPHFDETQNCLTQDNLTYLKWDLPSTRYIVIGPQAELEHAFAHLNKATSQQWQLLDMQANYPVIDLPLANQQLPQAFNLQNFNALSFDKGCYCGQEMVARAQYRGINKRALYLLTGTSDQLPQIGDALEQSMDGNWRSTGSILSALRVDDKTVWLQAVLNNDLDDNQIFRIANNTASELLIKMR